MAQISEDWKSKLSIPAKVLLGIRKFPFLQIVIVYA